MSTWSANFLAKPHEVVKRLPHFDVRPASVREKLTILKHWPLGQLAQYLNFFDLSLVIKSKIILEVIEPFERIGEFGKKTIFFGFENF